MGVLEILVVIVGYLAVGAFVGVKGYWRTIDHRDRMEHSIGCERDTAISGRRVPNCYQDSNADMMGALCGVFWPIAVWVIWAGMVIERQNTGRKDQRFHDQLLEQARQELLKGPELPNSPALPVPAVPAVEVVSATVVDPVDVVSVLTGSKVIWNGKLVVATRAISARVRHRDILDYTAPSTVPFPE